MIVADANVLIYLVCETSRTGVAGQVRAADAEWAAPALWEAEVLNGLLVMRRAGLLDLEDAVQAWRNAAAATEGRVHACSPTKVLETADRTGLSAYDAHYVVLARALKAYLVTEDKKLLRTCPDVARSMQAFVALPGAPTDAPGTGHLTALM